MALEPDDSASALAALGIEGVLSHMPGGFFVYRADADEGLIYANEACCRIFGCDDLSAFKRLTGFTFPGMVHPDDIVRVEDSIARQIAADQFDMDYVEYRIVRSDGAVRWIEDYGHFVRREAIGDIFYEFLGDATDTKAQMDKKARRQTEVIEGLSVSYESICYVDLDQDIVTPYRLSGRNMALFEGRLQDMPYSWYTQQYITTRVHPEDRTLVDRGTAPNYIREKLAEHRTYYFTDRVQAGEELQYIQLRVVNADPHQKVKHVVLGYRRVDEEMLSQMKQQALLAEALAKANLAVNSQNTFLSNMSHDMRTPLNAISGFTALAKRNLGNREAVENYLSQVETASRQLLDLIDKVLETTWLETNEAPAVEAACSLKSIVREICDFLQPQAEEKGIAFTVDLAGVEHDEVFSDQDMIHKLVMYLANNAVTYTKPGGRVSVTALERGELPGERGVYQLVIRDTGVGISKSFLERIFEPFSREQNTTLSGIHGIGLGLTIAKSIVDRMGGALEVKSEPGQGSTFTATLHLRRKLRQAAGPAGEGLPSLGEGRRILLVEDNEINREIETELLQDAGFTIDEAVNGAIAVEKVRASMPGEYDLILMDIQMPVMDGWQAAQAIRALANPALAAIPIVALSANVFQSDINKSLDSGMEAHLTKPIDIPALMKTIERILKRRAGAGGS